MSTSRHEQILERLRAEYREMAAMRLRLEQAGSLCGPEQPLCNVALEAFVEAKLSRVESGWGIRAVRVGKRNIRCARPVYTAEGSLTNSFWLGTARDPLRRRSGSPWPACFMLRRLASRGGRSRAVCF